MKLIVDPIRNHIVPILAKQTTAYLMLKSLENTFEVNNIQRTLALGTQLNHISMNKGEFVNAHFMIIIELWDQLSNVGHEIDSKELSLIALSGLPCSWELFKQGISARSKLPKLD